MKIEGGESKVIPINISVTGHRDLVSSNISNYKQSAVEIIKKIKKEYPSSPINILTGLAEGADMIIADAALAEGCNIVAVLPFAPDEYIQTFSDDSIRDRFESLLMKSKAVIDVSKINPKITGDDRYIELGIYLVNNSQRMIAMWDGIFNGKAGGSSDVVKFALEGIPYNKRKNYHILDLDDNIPVYHILTERLNPSKPAEEIEFLTDSNYSGYQVLYSKSWCDQGIDAAREYHNNILKRISTYNNDNKKVSEAEIKKSMGHVVDEEQQRNLSDEMKIMLREFAVSDVMASKFQKRTLWLLKLLLMGSFLVFFWVTLYDEILPKMTHLLLLVPIFFAFAYLVYKISQNKSIEAKYYEYRALSESLRVQFFWKTAYIKDNTYESYPRKSECDLGWVIFALSNISFKANYKALDDEKKNNYELIKSNWIEDQLNFYKKRYVETEKKIKKQKRTILTFFTLGIVFVMAMFILQRYFDGIPWVKSDISRSICLFMIDTLLAIGAVFSGFLEKRQYDSQNAQYVRMMHLYTQGIKEYTDALSKNDIDRLNDTIKEIGIEAICENADWVSYNRANSMDIPLGM